MPEVKKQKPNDKRPVIKSGSALTRLANAWDLTEHIKMLIYGRSGTGKTTLWASFPKPILAMICSGSTKPGELKSINTPELRKVITPVVVGDSTDIPDIIAEAGAFKTFVLDHGSGLQDLYLKEILGIDELPAQRSWGMAGQQQWGECSLKTKETLRAILSLDMHVAIVAQERNFFSEVESEVIAPTIGAALTPSVTGWLNPACDYVVQTFIRPRMVTSESKQNGKKVVIKKRGKGVEYCLRTEPHDIYQTKFRVPKGNPLPECIIDPTYDKIAKIIAGQ